jgi:glycerophosphoryl diester phosphodiesterase
MTPQIIAHRCSGTCYPDNSYDAAVALLKSALYGIDIDIHMTLDEAAIIQHNSTSSTGQEIRYTTYSDLPSSTPKLADVLLVARKYPDKMINIELKSIPIRQDSSFNKRFAKRVVAMVEEYGLADQIIYQSYDWEILLEIQSNTNHGVIAPITSKNPEIDERWDSCWMEWFEQFTHKKIDPTRYDEIVTQAIRAHFGERAVWSPDFRDLTKESMEIASNASLAVYSWTINSDEERKSAKELGIDVIFDNRPNL